MKLLDKLFKVGKERIVNGIVYKRLPLFGKYKYILTEDYDIKVELNHAINHPFIILEGGRLTIKKGYAWDGASGITIDTDSSMRGALIHDALYQLMREGLLDICNRDYADKLLRDICIEDGMYKWRAKYWYWCVSKFAEKYARPEAI